MAFTSAILGRTVWGDKRVHFGTYTTDSTDTGGDIDTGLSRCEFIVLQETGSSVTADAPVINETFAKGGIDGSAVTIVQTASADGIWLAIGH
jgi:hypothetical protein